MLGSLVAQPPRSRTAGQSKITMDDGRSSMVFRDPSEPYQILVQVPRQATDEEVASGAARSKPNTVVVPPYHWHIHQSETFHIRKGTMRATVEGSEVLVGEGKSITIPAQAYHTLRNASEKEELLYELVYDPASWEMTEKFFSETSRRSCPAAGEATDPSEGNLQSYLEDCRKHGVKPNIVQEIMILHAAEVVPALPGPKFIAKPAALLLNYVLAVLVGQWLLGWSDSYPEYYHPRTR